MAAIDRALALRPDWSEAWRHRGSTLITLGRADEALAAFELALALNPTEPGAHSGVARVHFVLRGDFAAAADRYERALALHPRAGWAALQLANCAAYLRDFPRAEAAARRAVELQQAVALGPPGPRDRGRVRPPRPVLRPPGPLCRGPRRVRARARVPEERRPRAARPRLHRAAPADRRGSAAPGRREGRPRRARPRGRGLRAAGPHRRRRPLDAVLRGVRLRAARASGSPRSRASSSRPAGGARSRSRGRAIEPAFEPLHGEPRFRAIVG